jgi:1-pyrroline-5-carboxylate dehydrogenase
MSSSIISVPTPVNEPVRNYAPGGAERASLEQRLDAMHGERVEIPIVIGGQRVKSAKTFEVRCPCEHGHVLATVHMTEPKHVKAAIESALKARHDWERLPWEQRVTILLRAAELLAGPHRDTLNAATMLGQGKNCFQAEIDAACELTDFWRFNCKYVEELYAQFQPPVSPPGLWNYTEMRALEGFVLAITPFNFTAIGGNLPTAPALLGNVALWKPSETQSLSAWKTFELLEEAGLPPGVINFLPGDGATIGGAALGHPMLAGVHFTGSTRTFQHIWQTIGGGISGYKSYPRIVGETGGKDFVVAHPSADVDVLAVALVRGAFEYQGQKCSAASRAYVPKSLWPKVRKKMYAMLDEIKLGDVRDFSCFVNAVIDERSYTKITNYIKAAKRASGVRVEHGGGFSDKVGWFIEPTLLLVDDPKYKTMCEEIFGPVLSLYVYNDKDWRAMLDVVNATSPYALTGAIIATDRAAVVEARDALLHASGNLYINDKPTGAVVGQQPFGGARASGTNDKAGSPLNLLRWTSQRAVKENLIPPKGYRYPFMG